MSLKFQQKFRYKIGALVALNQQLIVNCQLANSQTRTK